MPLISSSTPPSGGSRSIQVRNQEVVKEESDCQFEHFNGLDDDLVHADMEGSILNPVGPRRLLKAPAIPQRSEKRASRLLDSAMFELQSFGTSTPTEEQPADSADPHELYLSSEEDASFSDYDDEDSLTDFEPFPTDESAEQSSPSSRGSCFRSQEDTARIVSFVTAGKPQIIDIYIPSNSGSPCKQVTTTSTNDSKPELPQARRPSPIRNYPSALRRDSIISVSSGTANESISNSSTASMPYESTTSLNTFTSQKPSRMATIVTSTKNSFLSSDPFPKSEEHNIDSTESTPVTPKTPISMAAAAWRSGFGRTFAMARKQPASKVSSAANKSRVDLLIDGVAGEVDQWKQRQRAATTPQSAQESLGSYVEVISEVSGIKASLQKEAKERSYGLGMRGLTRRKSIKGKERLFS